MSTKPVNIILKLDDKVTKPLKNVQKQFDGFVNQKFGWTKKISQSLSSLSKHSGLAKVGQEAKEFGKTFATGLGLAGVGAGGLLALAKQTADVGDGLINVAKRIDFGVEAFQEYQYAAEQSGVSQEDFTKGLETFTRKVGEAKSGQGQLYNFLKKSNPELLKQVLGAKSNEEAFDMMVNSLGGVKDAQKQAAYSAMLFGKSGKNFTNLANEGANGINKLRETARGLGVMTEEQARKADDFGDTWSSIERLFLGLRNTLGSAMIPELQRLADKVMAFAKDNQPLIQKFAQDFAEKIPAAFEKGIEVFSALASIAETLLNTFTFLSGIFGTTATTVGVLALTIGRGLTMAIGECLVKMGMWFFTNTAMGVSLWNTTTATWALSRATGGGLVGSFLMASKAALVTAIAVGKGLAISFGVATLAALKFAAAMLANPVTWIVIGIVALIAALYLLWKNWDAVWAGIKSAGAAVMDWISSSFDNLMAKFAGIKDMLPSWLGGKTSAEVNVKNSGNLGTSAVQNFAQSSAAQKESQVKVSFDNLPKGARVDSSGSKNVETDVRMGLLATSTN